MTIKTSPLHYLQVFAASVLAFSTIGNAAELSGTPEELRGYLRSETRTVTISDSATEIAYSDVAKVTLIVTTEAKNLAAAMKSNNDLRDMITRQLLDAGVPADDIQSSKYSASPQYGWFGNKPNSFEVVNSLLVSVNEESLFRRVAEISDENDEVIFGGVDFEHSEKEAYEDKVRDKAVDAILSDQAYFENKLGLKLRPVAFTFSDVRAAEYDRYRAIEEIVVTANKASSFAEAAPSSFDEVEYRVSVSVTFEVEASE